MKIVKKNYNNVNKIIRYSIVFIWFLLLIFGYISFSKPAWLIDLSETGKTMEAQQSINKGLEALKQKNLPVALEAYKEAYAIQPKLESATLGIGSTYTRMGAYNKAITYYKNLLKDNADISYSLYYNLAEAYEKAGQNKKAIYYYKKSIEISPIVFYSLTKIGDIYFLQKEWDKAIQYYQKALQNKLDMKINYERSLKNALLNYSKPELIQKIKELLQEGFSEDVRKLYYQDRFQKILQKDKNLANIFNNIGFAYAMKGDMETAISYLKKALDIWPSSQRARQDLKKAMSILEEKKDNMNIGSK